MSDLVSEFIKSASGVETIPNPDGSLLAYVNEGDSSIQTLEQSEEFHVGGLGTNRNSGKDAYRIERRG